MRIIVNMACGLANRMFQYSYYLYLKSLNYNVYIDFYTNNKLAHENVLWHNIFLNATFNEAPKLLTYKLGGGSNIICKIRRRFLPFTCKIKQMQSAFDIILPEKGVDQYMMGVFQNAWMVDKMKDEILKSFIFQGFKDKQNLKYEKEMKSSESVAIHVRKGVDYNSAQYNIFFKNTCPIKYYKDAIDLLKGKYNNLKFYVFTDNPKWVKEHFEGIEYTLVEGNPTFGWGSHFDMQLMSYCKHNIISNSTYSWWGAFLNNNPQKTVILPHQWFNPESCEESTSKRLQCEGWIAL